MVSIGHPEKEMISDGIKKMKLILFKKTMPNIEDFLIKLFFESWDYEWLWYTSCFYVSFIT